MTSFYSKVGKCRVRRLLSWLNHTICALFSLFLLLGCSTKKDAKSSTFKAQEITALDMKETKNQTKKNENQDKKTTSKSSEMSKEKASKEKAENPTAPGNQRADKSKERLEPTQQESIEPSNFTQTARTGSALKLTKEPTTEPTRTRTDSRTLSQEGYSNEEDKEYANLPEMTLDELRKIAESAPS
uniref:Uncharacterized protein n=1 Tax=Caenorhabditis japonica TaxID=281687 RepID=A0A8R1E9I8_CAEJA